MPKRKISKEEPEYDETPQEKKLRLAKLYLEQLKEEGKLVSPVNIRRPTLVTGFKCGLFSLEEHKAEEDSFATDLIAGRLQEDVVRSDKPFFENCKCLLDTFDPVILNLVILLCMWFSSAWTERKTTAIYCQRCKHGDFHLFN